MFKAKDLHHTRAYQQLREAINNGLPEGMNKAAALGRLVTRVLNNINERRPNNWNFEADGSLKKAATIDHLMIWVDTNEGHEFWRLINHDLKLPKDFDTYPKKKPDGRVNNVAIQPAQLDPAPAPMFIGRRGAAIPAVVPMPAGIIQQFEAVVDADLQEALPAGVNFYDLPDGWHPVQEAQIAEQPVMAAPPEKRAKEPVKEPAKVLGWWGPVN